MKRNCIIIVLAALLIPGVMLAQDELTLESLSEQLTALTERVTTLESIFEGPGSVEIDDTCIIGGYNETEQQVQDQTVLNYKKEFDQFPAVEYLRIYSVSFKPDSGEIIVVYRDTDNWSELVLVSEIWNGCELSSVTDWTVQE